MIPLPTDRPAISTINDQSLLSTCGLIESYCTQPIQLRRYVDLDNRNQPTYSDPETIYCYYDRRPTKIYDIEGNLVVCGGTIYLPLSSNISLPLDQLWYNGELLSVIKCDIMRHFVDSHFLVWVK